MTVMFWIILALVTVIAVAVVALPILRAGQVRIEPLDHDREVYRARLGEIDHDLELGRISSAEAGAARAEAGRRLLALAGEEAGASADGPRAASGRLALVACAIAIPLISLGVYWQVGAPGQPDQPLLARLSADPSGQSIEALLRRAELRLADDPDDGRGWRVVAPVYLRLGRIDEAVHAYRNAIRTLGETPALQTDLAEALSIAAGGVITQEAHALFSAAAQADPAALKPRLFLAMAMSQAGDFADAIPAWERLIDAAPAQAEWLPLARHQLEIARGTVAGDAPGDPTAEDIEAAGQMSAEDRTQMVETMVASLADRLAEDPDNQAGWRRLIRSYMVLGRVDEARAAIATARGHSDGDAQFTAYLDAAQAELDGTAGGGDQ